MFAQPSTIHKMKRKGKGDKLNLIWNLESVFPPASSRAWTTMNHDHGHHASPTINQTEPICIRVILVVWSLNLIYNAFPKLNYLTARLFLNYSEVVPKFIDFQEFVRLSNLAFSCGWRWLFFPIRFSIFESLYAKRQEPYMQKPLLLRN